MASNYTKHRIALRYWLLGAGYHEAASAMNYAEGYHTGLRKDGDPEFSHQVSIVSYLRTMHKHLLYPEKTFSVGFLHDVREDYDVPDEAIRNRWGNEVADAVDAMTKVYRGVKRDENELFLRMGDNPIASIAKLSDRVHNSSTMLGAFSDEKMISYMAETERLFLPMLKRATRNFPVMEPAFQNAKLILDSQLMLLGAVLEARGKGEELRSSRTPST